MDDSAYILEPKTVVSIVESMRSIHLVYEPLSGEEFHCPKLSDPSKFSYKESLVAILGAIHS